MNLNDLGKIHEKLRSRNYRRKSDIFFNEKELQYIHASIGKMMRVYLFDATYEKVIDDLADVNKYNELLFSSLQQRLGLDKIKLMKLIKEGKILR